MPQAPPPKGAAATTGAVAAAAALGVCEGALLVQLWDSGFELRMRARVRLLPTLVCNVPLLNWGPVVRRAAPRRAARGSRARPTPPRRAG